MSSYDQNSFKFCRIDQRREKQRKLQGMNQLKIHEFMRIKKGHKKSLKAPLKNISMAFFVSYKRAPFLAVFYRFITSPSFIWG